MWVDFGVPRISQGLKALKAEGDPATLDGVTAEKWVPGLSPGGAGAQVGFQVEDGFAHRGNLSPLWILFEYYDAGEGSIDLRVDSVGQGNEALYRPVGQFFLSGENAWRLASVRLSDAYLGGRQTDGADFLLALTGDGPFILNRVWVVDTQPSVDLATDEVPFLPPGSLRVFLREKATRFSLGGIPVRVQDEKGNRVCELRVAPDGRFDLPSLSEGNYVLQLFWGPGKEAEKKTRVRGRDSGRVYELEVAVEGSAFRTVVFSSADGSQQPCSVYIPPDYDRRKAYPLILALHGTSGSDMDFIDALRLPLPKGMAETFIVSPSGHGNSHFAGIGETDVWDALNAVRQKFSIDPDRIYLIGHSMGATGAFRLATLHPDFFAAAVFIGPTVDPSLLEPVPSYAEPLMTLTHPFECISNLSQMATYWVYSASGGIMSASHSQNAVKALTDLGADAGFRELEIDRFPTWTDVVSDREIVRWLLSQERSRAESRVSFKTPSILYPRREWVEMDRFSGETWVAEIEAEIETESQIGVYVTGVEAYTLSTASLPLDRRGEITVFTNNQPIFEGRPPRDGKIHIQIAEPIIGPTKSPARCGPWRQAFTEPFVYVVGTGAERERLLGQINSLPLEEQFLLPPAPVRIADEISEEEKRDRNLVCLGTLATNPLLAELLHLTPVLMEGSRIQLGTAVFEGTDLSLHMIYPSPYWKEGLVQLNVAVGPECLGDFSFARYPIPDFLVLDEEGRSDPTGWKALAAGWFTPEWSLDMGGMYLRSGGAAGR